MIRVAYYPSYSELLKNQAFNYHHPWNAKGGMDKWCMLREILKGRGVDLNTYDMYKSRREIDVWLMDELVPDRIRFLLRSFINPRKVIVMMVEPPIINPWGWKRLGWYAHVFKAVLTWRSDLCRNSGKYFHYHFPVKFDVAKYPEYKSKTKKNLCLMMHSNKMSGEPGELYTLRREIIRYFEKRGDKLLDVYGYEWNTDKSRIPFFTDLYKGTTPDKRETYSEYFFSFCIDNSVVPGYITYDPLISMATGTVPIYMPMPDSKEFIPEDTFIDYGQFGSLDDLVAHLQELVRSGEYENYRRRGWEFINSPAYRPFTMEQFCEDVYRAITAVKRA